MEPLPYPVGAVGGDGQLGGGAPSNKGTPAISFKSFFYPQIVYSGVNQWCMSLARKTKFSLFGVVQCMIY